MPKFKIGHASISEYGTTYGVPGDTENREVYTTTYDIPDYFTPTIILRPQDKTLRELSAKACEDGCDNPAIGYDWDSRMSLYNEACKSEVNFDLSKDKLTARCNCDCSSFMTVCAVAGGAKFFTGGNAPRTAQMVSDNPGINLFLSNPDEYQAVDCSGADFDFSTIGRGDILVREGHTIMVLSDGENFNFTSDYKPSRPAIEAVTEKNIFATIKSITPTKVTMEVEIVKINNGEVVEDNESDITKYTWKYSKKSLEESNSEWEPIEIKSVSKIIEISSLKPNTSYAIKFDATEIGKNSPASSSEIIFTTPQSYPTAIRNLEVTTAEIFNGKFIISFDAPNSWGNSSLTKSYRLHLFVNGKSVAHTDTLLKSGSSYEKEEEITISEITDKKNLYTLGDTVQLGIQTGMKDGNKFIFDQRALVCSQPVFVRSPLKIIDRVYIKIGNGYKSAIFHNTKE